MSDAILLLRIEHHQTADILKIIEDLLMGDDQLDIELIGNIVEYFSEYPDQCHHPVEDLIYHLLKKRDREGSSEVAHVLRDHKAIAELTEKLKADVRSASMGTAANTNELRVSLQKFVDSYRAHMAAEEAVFFPLALASLKRVDWAEVDYALFDSDDPMFSKDAEERFRTLRRKIEERATVSFQRGAQVRDAKKLGQLTTIEAFNESMIKSDSPYRLIKHPEGAYGLEHNGHTVIDIPCCSPARAAWCAYYHVAALEGGPRSVKTRQAVQ